MKHFHTFQTEQKFVDAVVLEIHSRILNKTKEGKMFRLALSGGSTPGPIYRRLAEQDVPWEWVEIYLVDERYVPIDHPHSNYRMIRETLLDHVHPKKVVYFDTSLPIEECLQKYESNLDQDQEKFFDLILLGIGMDGHTASLFPESPALLEKKRWVAHTTTDQFDVRDRLTLTFPALRSSNEIFFFMKGEEKKKAFINKFSKDETLPAWSLLQDDKTTIYFTSSQG